MRTRAERRAAADKRKAWARFLLRNIWWNTAGLADNPRFVGHMARTRKPCSCLGCGNERQSEGLTMQERRAALDALDGH